MNLKNKKIAFFIGMAHHSRFLIPIVERTKNEGADILLFTVTTDYPFEKELLKRGYKFKFISEYADEETRKKIKNAVNTILDEWIKLCFEWDGFRHWSLFEQHRSLNRNIEEYFCLEQMIKVEKPDMLIALHEINPWGKQVGHLAMKYAIPYLTLQEGEYYTDMLAFTGHTEYSTADLLWGETTKNMLVKWKCSPDKIVIIGNTHIDEAINSYSTPSMRRKIKKDIGISEDKKVISFLIDAEWGTVTSKGVWDSLLNGLARLDLVCVFKWHPNVTYRAYKEIEAMIKEILPSVVMLYTYDPYKILAITDYCIVLGKTTLGIEALAFGKPLFAIPTLHEQQDHYASLGVAQSVSPLGNWENLFRTIKNGIPDDIKKNADVYLRQSFYRLDGKSVGRALEVISYILECRQGKEQRAKSKEQKNSTPHALCPMQKGRVSFIIPSGNDQEALLSTLTSLSQNVKYNDWEVVLVINDENIKEMLSGISGDIKIVDSQGDNLSLLYNKGAEASTGEYLIFMKPGIVYFKDEGLIDAAKDGVAGIPLKNPDMTPYCLGIGFDFNFAPYFIKDEGHSGRAAEGTVPDLQSEQSRVVESGLSPSRDAVGGGLIGMHRSVFESIGGFDEGIANHLAEADACLSAKDKGYFVKYLPDCLGFVFRETFTQQSDRAEGTVPDLRTEQSRVVESGLSPSRAEDEWKQRIRFFAKWWGKLPKDDDYIKFAGDLLKV